METFCFLNKDSIEDLCVFFFEGFGIFEGVKCQPHGCWPASVALFVGGADKMVVEEVADVHVHLVGEMFNG